MSEQLPSGPLLSEEVAHRLLARAVALDAARGSTLSLEQLRAAAHEAGISDEAFERAVHEWGATGLPAAPAPAVNVSAGARLRTWLRLKSHEVRQALSGKPVRHLLALAAFWGVLMVLVSLDRANAVPWLVRKATDPVALGIGALIASRLRARPVALLLAGLAVAQGAEFVMDAALGTPSVQGFGSHWALMIAGVAGVLLGRNVARPPAAGASDASQSMATSEANEWSRQPLERVRAFLLRPHSVLAAKPDQHPVASV